MFKVPLFCITILVTFCGMSCLKANAQDISLVPVDEKTMLQRVTNGKRDIDWANMNIQFCSAADASFTNGSFDDMAFKVHR